MPLNAVVINARDGLLPADLDALRHAKRVLENPGVAMRMASRLGVPFEKLLARVPKAANGMIADATRTALEKCLSVALKTMGNEPVQAPVGGERRKPRAGGALLHKVAVATTGAAGGAFGLAALPFELPVTTTLMFRSISEIARAEGEDLSDQDAQMQCLMVLAMGGPSRADDDASYGYFVVRGAVAQAVTNASSEALAKGFLPHGSASLLRAINAVAARFSVQVSEQVAAKSIPLLGAALGATVNTVFMGHYQDMARGHFTVRRLERQYGVEHVRALYDTL